MPRLYPLCVAGVCLALLCCAARTAPNGGHPSPLAADALVQESRYARTVRALRGAPPAQLADFALIALGELAEVYMAEADLARREAVVPDADAKLAGWSRAVDRYADQLMVMMDGIERGQPVQLSLLREGGVSLTAVGRAVLLGHPRPEQQAAYEQRVLMAYCARHTCADAASDKTSGAPIPVAPAPARPDWTFSNNGAQCARGGIAVRFAHTAALPRYRAICAQLLREAHALADDMIWQRRQGVVIQWDALAIRSTPRPTQQLVQLNTRGDAILGALPLLNTSPALLRDLVPWLRSRAAGEALSRVELDAARYGWETAEQGETPAIKPDIY